MPKFNVCVSRDLSEQTVVEIEADTSREALQKARDMDLSDANWELTDYVGSSHYDVFPE